MQQGNNPILRSVLALSPIVAFALKRCFGAKKKSLVPATTMPQGRRYLGMPVPFFFIEDAALRFREMETKTDDVFVVSLPKGGTTWVNKIVWSLVHGFDEKGQARACDQPGTKSQVYPEAVPRTRGSKPGFFGDYIQGDLYNMPSPRIFATHMTGSFLPSKLTASGDTEGKGKVVVVVRNLKDVMVSLHYFRGEAKDGWKGNKHGPGSFNRFISDDCPNAYGSSFDWVKTTNELVHTLHEQGKRVHIVYFEALKRDVLSELRRLAAFLEVPLPEAKLLAVADAVSFSTMKDSGNKMYSVLLRKGDVAGWRTNQNVTQSDWAKFDAVFERKLSGVELAEGMWKFVIPDPLEPSKLPPPISEQGLDCDPRTWDNFTRVTLKNGMVVRDTLISSGTKGAFKRPASEFNGVVVAPGCAGWQDAEFVAEAGRYHLFVSGVCPWANGVLATLHTLGLQEVLTVDMADGQSGLGWVFLNGSTCPPFSEREGPFFLHEAYQASDATCTARITVPVLWDKKTGKIVSNDSWTIIKILSTAFLSFSAQPSGAAAPPNLFPEAQRQATEALQATLYHSLLNGVYRSGVALVKSAPEVSEKARIEVYKTLDLLEARLESQPYLMGKEKSCLDIRVVQCLLRFDTYFYAFALNKLNRGRILTNDDEQCEFPRLRAYVRAVIVPFQHTILWGSYRQYYRWTVGHPRDLPLPSLQEVVEAATGAQ